MEIFAFICLIVILVSIQHLLNWGWRVAVSSHNDNTIIGMIVISLVAALLSVLAGRFLILWGYQILN